MPRKLVLKHPLFEIEQCPAENVRVSRVRGLRLYDEQEEEAHGSVIDLDRLLPGVAQFQGLSYLFCPAGWRVADRASGFRKLKRAPTSTVACSLYPLRAMHQQLSKYP